MNGAPVGPFYFRIDKKKDPVLKESAQKEGQKEEKTKEGLKNHHLL